MIDISLQEQLLDVAACEAFVATPDAGGMVSFVGMVRRQTQGKVVLRLEFEAYAPMARREMARIAERALVEYKVLKISLHHRVGVLEIGEAAVVIAVSAPHRAAAFEACRFCIDELKRSVPIWKKEIFEDGEVWVAAHP